MKAEVRVMLILSPEMESEDKLHRARCEVGKSDSPRLADHESKSVLRFLTVREKGDIGGKTLVNKWISKL